MRPLGLEDLGLRVSPSGSAYKYYRLVPAGTGTGCKRPMTSEPNDLSKRFWVHIPYSWTLKIAKRMDPILPLVSVLRYWWPLCWALLEVQVATIL